MVIGVICLVASFISDGTPHHTEFWANILQNTMFFTGVSFIALYLLCCHITGYSGWHIVFKRILEAISLFLPIGLLLMTVLLIGMWTGSHHLWLWSVEGITEKDELIRLKSRMLNMPMMTIVTYVVMGIWIYFAWRLRALSTGEDASGYAKNYRKIKRLAATFLPIGAFTSAFIIWYWLMSIDPHWYSTMFAWYTTASWLVSCCAILALLMMFLNSAGALPEVTQHHFHDVGKYIFGFSVFWTYLWFSQYMLIWYANVGEETIYFRERLDNFPLLFYGNLVLNFALPFLILIRNETKWKWGTLGFVACLVIFGHWIDFWQMVRPGLHYEMAHHAHDAAHGAGHAGPDLTGFMLPSFVDFGVFLGFLGLFLFTTFTYISRANLQSRNDALMMESVHHHV